MNDIGTRRASIWCERFGKLMKENGYTQEAFLKEYRKKYGGGTQANKNRDNAVVSVPAQAQPGTHIVNE